MAAGAGPRRLAYLGALASGFLAFLATISALVTPDWVERDAQVTLTQSTIGLVNQRSGLFYECVNPRAFTAETTYSIPVSTSPTVKTTVSPKYRYGATECDFIDPSDAFTTDDAANMLKGGRAMGVISAVATLAMLAIAIGGYITDKSKPITAVGVAFGGVAFAATLVTWAIMLTFAGKLSDESKAAGGAGGNPDAIACFDGTAGGGSLVSLAGYDIMDQRLCNTMEVLRTQAIARGDAALTTAVGAVMSEEDRDWDVSSSFALLVVGWVLCAFYILCIMAAAWEPDSRVSTTRKDAPETTTGIEMSEVHHGAGAGGEGKTDGDGEEEVKP